MPSNRTASRSSTKFISPMTLSRYGCGKSHMTNKKNPKPNPNVHLTPTLYLISSQIFEVATNTKVKDLIQNIANKLKLSSAHGYSIFVKTQDKVNLTDFELGRLMPLMRSDPVSVFQVLSSNDADYFFDSLRQITDWSRRTKRVKDGRSTSSGVRDSWTLDT